MLAPQTFPKFQTTPVGLFRRFIAVVKKKTGFRRSELREETHEKACLASIYDRNRDLIRAKTRKHIGRSEMGVVRICQLKTDLGSDPVQGVVDIF